MIIYKAVKERLFSSEIGEYTSYGISAFNADKKIIIHVSDVFSDYDEACNLADICNKYCLDPIQLPDIIEDAVSGGSYAL